MDSNITSICGESNVTINFEEIKSDPNFVFTADPNFLPVTLYNEGGSAITVNSWIECANYVYGGWRTSLSDLVNYEQNIFFILLIVAALVSITEIYIKFKERKYFKK